MTTCKTIRFPEKEALLQQEIQRNNIAYNLVEELISIHSQIRGTRGDEREDLKRKLFVQLEIIKEYLKLMKPRLSFRPEDDLSGHLECCQHCLSIIGKLSQQYMDLNLGIFGSEQVVDLKRELNDLKTKVEGRQNWEAIDMTRLHQHFNPI